MVVADNTKLRAAKRGTVTISVSLSGKIHNITVENVLYVPNLNVNLLSVRKITKKGYVMTFDEHFCKIVNNKRRVVAIAEPANNIYQVKQSSKTIDKRSV